MSIDLDERWRLMSPTCRTCRHRHWDVRNWRVHATCDAFPEGIPIEIWNGQHPHRTPFTGDHGIRFEPMTEEDERAYNEWLDQRIVESEERARLMREGKLPPVHKRNQADATDPNLRAAS
jgi:hypothetical protein